MRAVLRYRIFYNMEMSRYALDLKLDAVNPRIGHVHRPNRDGQYMGVELKTNSDGFRDREYDLVKNDKQRIIFLGDSLTLGWGVAREATFEYLLEQEMDRQVPTEIINFGAGNYNTSQETHVFLEKGLKYTPDRVVVFYFINDAEPTPHRSRLAWLAHFRLSTFYWSRLKSLRARFSPTAGFEHFYRNLYVQDHEGWAETKRAFALLKDVCDRYGIEVQVVILPELHNLTDYPFKREHDLVMQVLEQNDILALDLLPFFEGEEDSTSLWVALDDAHPNAEAHRRIAEYSLDFLLQSGDKDF